MSLPLIKHCKCGLIVWDGAVPRYTESIICQGCRTDHSITPGIWWRVRYARYHIHKRLKLQYFPPYTLPAWQRWYYRMWWRFLHTSILKLRYPTIQGIWLLPRELERGRRC